MSLTTLINLLIVNNHLFNMYPPQKTYQVKFPRKCVLKTLYK